MALFVDSGKVAARASDLDLARHEEVLRRRPHAAHASTSTVTRIELARTRERHEPRPVVQPELLDGATVPLSCDDVMTLTTFPAGTSSAPAAMIAATADAAVGGGTEVLRRRPDLAWSGRRRTRPAIKPTEIKLFVDLASNIARGGSLPIPRPRGQRQHDRRGARLELVHEPRSALRALTPTDIANGPDTSNGPAPGAWTITSSKSDGVTPGFTVKDAPGQRWFLKFDPPGYRGDGDRHRSDGDEADVGARLQRSRESHRLSAPRAARRSAPARNSRRRAARRGRCAARIIDALLQHADREANGSYRVVASKALAGKPVGRIRFYGTSPDDPNDIVPHEDRRELRGYGVFAAWLNHVDAKAINSLDTLVTENGTSFVRHT